MLEKLYDTIYELYSEDISISAHELFKNACDNLNIEISFFYKEDIINVGLYCCQIILNGDIFLKAVSGNSESQAYENVIRKFINLCFQKKNVSFRYPEYIPESFYLELKESIDNIDLSNNLRNNLKKIFENEANMGQLSKSNTINYRNAKKILTKDNMIMSETYRRINDSSVTCSILVNDVLLLQQSDGKDNDDALENTVTKFLKAYGIITNEKQNGASLTNGDIGVGEMMKQLGILFREKKKNAPSPVNYWDIIQDCTYALKYKLVVKSGHVEINNVPIVNIEESNEYVGNIKAGKELIKILSMNKGKPSIIYNSSVRQPQPVLDLGIRTMPVNAPYTRHRSTEIMNFPKSSKVYNAMEREELMKTIAIRSNNEYLKDARQTIWTVINREFLNEKCKLEVRYEDKIGNTECTLTFQGHAIVSGLASNRITSREVAAKNFLTKYKATQ